MTRPGPPRTARCGTTSGYTRHQLDGEKPCDACALAKKEYDKRRKEVPRIRQLNRLHARAQTRALSRLRVLYRDEYRAFYAEEKALLLAELERDEQS